MPIAWRAETEIEKGLKKQGKDADVLKLEKAMVDLASGELDTAEKTLREVRDNLDRPRAKEPWRRGDGDDHR